MVRISLLCLALSGLVACVKPATTSVTPHSPPDLYNLCGDTKNACSSTEQAPLVDTNLSTQPHGTLNAGTRPAALG